MLVLGIESTCDETGCAIVRDGREILSNVVLSQDELHRCFGGVIPELAARRHVDVLFPLLQKALVTANVTIDAIDLIAVANGPGLIGSILVGLNFAKGLALSLDKPLIGINHVEAHLYAVLMEQTPALPALGVVISGGHTSLIKISQVGSYQVVGQTQDDAIGEAFDKAARLLSLSYPGGPEIEKLAQQGNPLRYSPKGGQIKDRPFDFSFSGLKTNLLYLIKGQNNCYADRVLTTEERSDLAASFQHSAFSYLVEKISLAAEECGCHSIIVGGGVSQNHYLRTLLKQKVALPVFWPQVGLCLDNAAMIAGLGAEVFRHRGGDSMQLEARTHITFATHI